MFILQESVHKMAKGYVGQVVLGLAKLGKIVTNVHGLFQRQQLIFFYHNSDAFSFGNSFLLQE